MPPRSCRGCRWALNGQGLTACGAAGGLSGRVARRSAGIWSSRTGHRCRAGAPAGAGPASSSSGRNRDSVLHCHQPWPSGASADSSPALRASFPSTGSALTWQAPATRTRQSKRDLQDTRHHSDAAAYPAASAVATAICSSTRLSSTPSTGSSGPSGILFGREGGDGGRGGCPPRSAVKDLYPERAWRVLRCPSRRRESCLG